jgi:murein DD-endopeptidase MepM/ murein hydrolase activator NlpD
MKKIFSILLLLVVCILLRPLFVASENIGGTQDEINKLNQEITQKKSKIKQLEESIADYKKQIAQKQTESASLDNQISILDNYRAQTELDIEITQNKLDSLTLEIESFDLEIEQKEQVIGRQKVILSELIKNLHYEHGKKYIEIATAYKNFSDFYNRVHYIDTLERDMGESAKTIRLAKEEVEEKKKQTEERKKIYEETKIKLENKKKDLEEQASYKETLLAQTKSSEATYKTLVSSLNTQYKQIENEITATEQEVRRRLSAQNKITATPDTDTTFSWPTDSRYVTAYFHDKNYPYRSIFEHPAIDIRASHGTPIRAVASGYIGTARTCTTASCYAYVMIIHNGGFSSVYGHLSKILVSADQFVNRGDVIGYSGATPGTIGAGPFTTGAHLHLEVRKDGIPVNPLNYLAKDWE